MSDTIEMPPKAVETIATTALPATSAIELDATKPQIAAEPPPLANWSVAIEGSAIPPQIVKNARSADTAKYVFCRANKICIQNQKFIVTKL